MTLWGQITVLLNEVKRKIDYSYICLTICHLLTCIVNNFEMAYSRHMIYAEISVRLKRHGTTFRINIGIVQNEFRKNIIITDCFLCL